MAVRVRVKLKDFKQLINLYIRDKKWPSSDGTIRDISDMTNDHIINTIKLIKLNKWREVYLPIFYAELKRRVMESGFNTKLFDVDELIEEVTKI